MQATPARCLALRYGESRTSVLDLSALPRELGEVLRATVDVVPADGRKPHLRDEVLREAIAL